MINVTKGEWPIARERLDGTSGNREDAGKETQEPWRGYGRCTMAER